MIRKRRRSTRTVLLAAALVVPTLLTGSTTSPAAANPSLKPKSTPTVAGTVTLLTGDRVTVGGPGMAAGHGLEATVRPAPGREKMPFLHSKDERGELSVVPADMQLGVSSGRLDRRLFTVTELIRNGYDDRSRTDIPLIVSPLNASAVQRSGVRAIRPLTSIGATAVRVDKAPDRAKAFLPAVAEAERIWLDGPVHATLDQSVPQIGAPEAWRAGYTGKGTTVAVLDTGVNARHPDLDGAVSSEENFSDSPDTDDRHGHGTHVASIITGQHDKYQGVAPDSTLLSGKVLDDSGGGWESQIIAGMEWAAGRGAKVINMSLSTGLPSDGTDLMSQAVNRLSAQTGALFVVAAGNNRQGQDPLRVGSPAAADAALAVGAVDKQDALAPFSKRGPRILDDAIKPEITAPGVGIAAALAKGAVIGTPVDEEHTRLSGTSMAAPHVAGAAAILAAQHPEWTGSQVKSVLMGSARPNPDLTVFEQGSGRLDVARAVTQPVHATPASINNGVVPAPHDQTKTIVKTLTYHNSAATPITLDLTVDGRGPDGKPAPAGVFTVAPARLTVPPGGQAEATATTSTAAGEILGVYSGVITASGGAQVRTPIAVTRDIESYEVKLSFIGRDGKPASDYSMELFSLTEPRRYSPYNSSGTVTLRVPKGRYTAFGHVDIFGSDSTSWAEPELSVTGPTTLTIDARDAKPIEHHVAPPKAERVFQNLILSTLTDWGGTFYAVAGGFGDAYGRVLALPSKTSAPPKRFTFTSIAALAEPDGNGGFSSSPYNYLIEFSEDQRIPENLSRRFPDDQLALVRSRHAAIAPGMYGHRNLASWQVPFELNVFYSPGVPWYSSLCQSVSSWWGDPDACQVTPGPVVFKPGEVRTDRFDFGVRGPGFPQGSQRNEWAAATRLGNEVRFELSLLGDDSGRHLGWAGVSWTGGGGSQVLTRDGKPITALPDPDYPWMWWPHRGRYLLPDDPGTYRLHMDVFKQPVTRSMKVSSDWTFTSGPVSGQAPQALPLLAVRYNPKLDDNNQAPAWLPTVLPISVEHNSGGTGTVRSLRVSYDDGGTWREVPVITAGNRAFAILVHPRDAKAVSLNATATDDKGNSVDQTIVRAFTLR